MVILFSFSLAFTPQGIFVCSFSPLKAKAFSKNRASRAHCITEQGQRSPLQSKPFTLETLGMCSLPARRENKVGWRTTHPRFVFPYKGSCNAEAIYSQPCKCRHRYLGSLDLALSPEIRSLLLWNKAAPSASSKTQSCLCIRLCCPHHSNHSVLKERVQEWPPGRTWGHRQMLTLFGTAAHGDEGVTQAWPALGSYRHRIIMGCPISAEKTLCIAQQRSLSTRVTRKHSMDTLI